MQKEEITALFDQQAESYDQQWSRLSALNGALHLLASAVLSELPPTANILCIGAGTGAEIMKLAQCFPGWRFTAVEPSLPMLEVFRRKATEQGIADRCVFHAGYLDSLPQGEAFDAATAFLVSQFILDPNLRAAFFSGIAERLRPGGLLLSSDLAANLETAEGQDLLKVWSGVMSKGGVTDEALAKMRDSYNRDVAVLPPPEILEMIKRGGFEPPVLFFQAGLIHASYARRS